MASRVHCDGLGATQRPPVEEIELYLLCEGVYRRYGIDLRHYSPASLARRIREFMDAEGLGTISDAQACVLHDAQAFGRFVEAVSVPITAMFRDPAFYRAFRERIAPALRSVPFLRVWHAGCATGEEVYSTAILLQEEGLLDRTRIYATDINESAIRRAKQGVFPLRKMHDYSLNYQKAAGQGSFSDYYTARSDHATFSPELKKNIVWGAHNLATDASFNEFQVIMCRNVMIYFTLELRRRVHELLHDSLQASGYLALGYRESLQLTGYESRYAPVHDEAKIYRKLN